MEKRGSSVAVTGEQQELLESNRAFKGKPLEKIGRYLDAADVARTKLAADPENALVRSDYNFAVGRIIEVIGEEKLEPWEQPLICPSGRGDSWSLTLPPPDPRPEYHPRNFEMSPADRLEFKGELVGERMVKQGLGAPTVVVGKDIDFTKIDQFAQGKQVFYGLTGVADFEGSGVTLRMLDPLNQENVLFDGHEYPLAGDFQAPLALGLAELDMKKKELKGFFKPDELLTSARLARLQPYDPEKIPVVCIHGLGNSPATWMPVIDFLRNDPVVRENYQFWFFSYPTGIAYPMMTAVLRHQLDQFNERYPDHKDIVVIGHSMGGMIARLLISENGTQLWDAYYDRPPEEIPFSDWTRMVMKRTLIFEPQEDIGRVIFASASHRGSDDASGFLGKLGAKAIGDPINDHNVNEEALRYVRPEIGQNGQKHLPNSIEVLNPENRFLKLVDQLPLKSDVPFHSIIGDRGKGGNLDKTKPQSSDGIVPYWSSHLDGAESELIIPSGHWSHLHPMGMAEIKRILILHAAAP